MIEDSCSNTPPSCGHNKCNINFYALPCDICGHEESIHFYDAPLRNAKDCMVGGCECHIETPEESEDMPGVTRESLMERALSIFLENNHNVALWFNSPNRGLDGETPQSYMDAKRYGVIDNLLGAIEHGFPS